MSISSLCTITGDTSSVPAVEAVGAGETVGAGEAVVEVCAKALFSISNVVLNAIKMFMVNFNCR
jgi:hypothetical protein